MTPDNFSIATWLAFSLLGLLFAAVSAFTMPLFNWLSAKFWNRVAGGKSKNVKVPCPHCGQELKILLYKRKQNMKLITCPACKRAFDISDIIEETWNPKPKERQQIGE